MDSKSGMQFFRFSLHYYVLYSNMVIYEELIVSYSWYQSQPWIRIKTYELEYFIFLGFIPNQVSVQFRKLSSNQKLNFIAYLKSTRRDEKIGGWHVTGGGRTRPHAPPRALSTTAREGHAPDLKPNWFADVMMTSA